MCRLKWQVTLSIRNVSDFEALSCQFALSQICVLTQIQNIKQDKEELKTQYKDVELNWMDVGRLRKRRLVDYSEC